MDELQALTSREMPDVLKEDALRRVHDHLSWLFLRKGLTSSPLPVEGIARCFDLEREMPCLVFFMSSWVAGFERVLDEIYVPDRRSGIAIRQVESGRFVAAAQGGDSIGEGITGGATGTMGCMVEDAHGQKFVLSCNHVIAGINARIRRLDEVWSPGADDGGTSRDRVGVLHDYGDLVLDGTTVNYFDAAVALPDNTTHMNAAVQTIGRLHGSYVINSPDILPIAVKKYGNATKYTTGNVIFQGVNFKNTYSNGTTAVFYNQLGIVGADTEFAKQGDSGAAVVESNNLVVGLVFSVSEGIDLTLANPIEPILGHFGVSIAT